MNKKKTISLEMLVLTAYALILTLRNIQSIVGTYVTTMYAFTYDHGFLARGVMGTILKAIDLIIPGEQYNFAGVRAMCYACDFLFVGILLAFFAYCLSRCESTLNRGIFSMAFVLGTFAFPEYIAFQNFGRTDAACAVLTIIMVWLIIRDKAVWLCVPLCALGVMIHQGFVLQFIGAVLVLLFVRMCDCFTASDFHNKKGWYYFAIAALSVVAAAVIFLYLNFNHTQGRAAYDEILKVAQSLAYPGYNGEVHKQLLMHEILGEDPASDEWAIHVLNFKEGAIYAVLMLPYLIIAGRFFAKCIKRAAGWLQKLKYVAVAVGAWLILPDLIVKIDYGRWIFSMILYFFLVVMALLMMQDEIITGEFHASVSRIRKHPALVVFLFVYPVFFTPMGDTWISQLSLRLANLLSGLM